MDRDNSMMGVFFTRKRRLEGGNFWKWVKIRQRHNKQSLRL
jgi:hypothetical protein